MREVASEAKGDMVMLMMTKMGDLPKREDINDAPIKALSTLAASPTAPPTTFTSKSTLAALGSTKPLPPPIKLNDGEMEVEYDRNPTDLFQALEARQYSYAAVNQDRFVRECKTWVVASSNTNTRGKEKLNFRVLPLHAAIVFDAPHDIIDRIIEAYPDGVQRRDLEKRLPLHLAMAHNASEEVVAKLIKAYPQSLFEKDGSDKDPFDYAQSGGSVDQAYLKKFIPLIVNAKVEEERVKWSRSETSGSVENNSPSSPRSGTTGDDIDVPKNNNNTALIEQSNRIKNVSRNNLVDQDSISNLSQSGVLGGGNDGRTVLTHADGSTLSYTGRGKVSISKNKIEITNVPNGNDIVAFPEMHLQNGGQLQKKEESWMSWILSSLCTSPPDNNFGKSPNDFDIHASNSFNNNNARNKPPVDLDFIYTGPGTSNIDGCKDETQISPMTMVTDKSELSITGPGSNGRYPERGRAHKIEITHVPECDNIPELDDEAHPRTSKLWWAFSRMVTLFVPDRYLCCVRHQMHARVAKGMSPEAEEVARDAQKEANQAWREKVAIFVIMLFFSICFIGLSGAVPMFLCKNTVSFTMGEIQRKDKHEDWTVVFGKIYDIQEFLHIHPGGLSQMMDAIATDASSVFPRRPPSSLPSLCFDKTKDLSSRPRCDAYDDSYHPYRLHCHSTVGLGGVDQAMGRYEIGTLAHRRQDLKKDEYTEWFMIYNRIYNVSAYVESIKHNVTQEVDIESKNAYLSEDLNHLILYKREEDATAFYEKLYEDDVALSCLDELFYIGDLDEVEENFCQVLNITMSAVTIIIASVLVIQCVCSLLYLVRCKRAVTRDDTRSKIIVMVPCYNEGDRELRKTIESVMNTSYPQENKCLLVVADGNITGRGERMSTPETLSKILGYKMSRYDRMYTCKSIGEHTVNRAKLYYGIYRISEIEELKYMVVVKCGLSCEEGSAKAGNRGKRDSQLLFTGLLNRYHHGRELNELDQAIKGALDHMKLPLDEVRYLMAIDADTRVDRESISQMAHAMSNDSHVLALCGETKVENKAESWVTMIQVFEYYTSHHMKKGFESVFGCVTCLPGCFTMYRLFSNDGRPLLSCDDVYQRYATNNVKSLHEKNLYHLGEDRMLTTLLLRYFPDMRLSFVPEATCYTIVPHTFSVLLSQRRRWINSTFHNMLELIRVNGKMCGVCCISMKSIVILDLIATLILPASLIYVGYIIYITVYIGESLSTLMVIVWGIVIGVQVLVFLLRSRWDYWWWFFVYIFAGVPVFYLILPLYSFWHMDDFSWGETRKIAELQRGDGDSGSGGDTVPDTP